MNDSHRVLSATAGEGNQKSGVGGEGRVGCFQSCACVRDIDSERNSQKLIRNYKEESVAISPITYDQ